MIFIGDAVLRSLPKYLAIAVVVTQSLNVRCHFLESDMIATLEYSVDKYHGLLDP